VPVTGETDLFGASNLGYRTLRKPNVTVGGFESTSYGGVNQKSIKTSLIVVDESYSG
jgi:hypothetical protein